MNWYDWAVIAIAIALVVRGWTKGVIREAIDVALLLVGTLLAFRLSPAVGSIIAGMTQMPYEVARVVAGGVILVALVVGSLLLGRVVAAALHVVPGASKLNKLGGAAIGLVYAAVVVALVTTLVAASPLPSAARASVDETMDASAIASAVTDPTGAIQPVLAGASGEEMFRAVIAVR